MTPLLILLADKPKYTIFILLWDCDVADVHEEILSAFDKSKLREKYFENVLYSLERIEEGGIKAFISGRESIL